MDFSRYGSLRANTFFVAQRRDCRHRPQSESLVRMQPLSNGNRLRTTCPARERRRSGVSGSRQHLLYLSLPAYNRDTNNRIVLAALASFGINAEASGRNDLVVPHADGPRKVSGSAFFESSDRAFHHGTLLMNTDLGRLENYLTPHPKKLASKGRASVRARVMNLSEIAADIRHETLSPRLVEAFAAAHQGEAEIKILDEATLRSIPSLQNYFEKYASWDWRFGQAPSFEHEMTEYLSWGFVQVFVDSERGHITRARVFSDTLFPDMVEDFEGRLVGRAYSALGISAALAETEKLHPARRAELLELGSWLKTQIEV